MTEISNIYGNLAESSKLDKGRGPDRIACVAEEDTTDSAVLIGYCVVQRKQTKMEIHRPDINRK
eukprot:10008780-Heterocapsa_arctica.AAC.1